MESPNKKNSGAVRTTTSLTNFGTQTFKKPMPTKVAESTKFYSSAATATTTRGNNNKGQQQGQQLRQQQKATNIGATHKTPAQIVSKEQGEQQKGKSAERR